MRRLMMMAAAGLVLAACDNRAEAPAEDLNAANATLDNMAMDNMAMDNGAMMNATNSDGTAANMADPNTQNAVAEDMATNNADANLANGM